MVNAFDMMAASLHADPNMGEAAFYVANGQPPRRITVILYSAAVPGIGGSSTTRITQADIRAIEVPQPVKGEFLQIGGKVYSIATMEMLPGGVWRCDLSNRGR